MIRDIEIEEYMKMDRTIKSIRELAHKYWIEDGKPNGEEYRDHEYWGRMKIKDIHWRRASSAIEGYYAHNAGGDW